MRARAADGRNGWKRLQLRPPVPASVAVHTLVISAAARFYQPALRVDNLPEQGRGQVNYLDLLAPASNAAPAPDAAVPRPTGDRDRACSRPNASGCIADSVIRS